MCKGTNNVVIGSVTPMTWSIRRSVGWSVNWLVGRFVCQYF